jgi:hypothetical protein
MHIGQLEDRILEARPRAIQRSTPRLAVSTNLKTLRTRVARLKLLTGQLAVRCCSHNAG